MKRKQKYKRNEPVQYVLTVTGWDYYYSFSIGHKKIDDGPYSELSLLKFRGDFIRPENGPFKHAVVTLRGLAGMLELKGPKPAKLVGLLSSHEDVLEAHMFIPAERLAELAAIANSGRVKVIAFTGTELKYHQGLVKRMSLNTEFNEEDF